MKLLYIIYSVLSKQCRFLTILAIFYYSILPMNARAASNIVINEIAWAGSSASPNDEWIELRNVTDYAINIDGWRLRSAEDSPNITLRGTIPSGGYFLLERTDDQSVPNIAASQIYSGAFGNDGEKLTLTDAYGIMQDEINASSGWPAGDAKTKHTMERDLNLVSWHTGPANGTPLAKNTIPNSIPSSASTEKNEGMALLKTSANKTIPESYPVAKNNLQQQNLLADIGTNNPQQFSDELRNNQNKHAFEITPMIVTTILILFTTIFGLVFIANNKE